MQARAHLCNSEAVQLKPVQRHCHSVLCLTFAHRSNSLPLQSILCLAFPKRRSPCSAGTIRRPALPVQRISLLCHVSAPHRHPSLYLGTAKLFLSITAHILCSAFPSRASPLPCPDTQIRRTAPDPVQCLLNALLCFSWASHIIASPLPSMLGFPPQIQYTALHRHAIAYLFVSLPMHSIAKHRISDTMQSTELPLLIHAIYAKADPRTAPLRDAIAVLCLSFQCHRTGEGEDHSSRSSSSSQVKRPLPLFRHCPKPRSRP